MSLVLSNRYFLTASASSIQDIPCALIELITNSVDAYSEIERESYPIYITTQREKDYTLYIVSDEGCGMTFNCMQNKLMVVGNYTACSQARGMFGRGAKDCAALGDLNFLSVKDKKMSEINISSISTQAKITVLQEDVPTDKENGTTVTLKVANYLSMDIDRLCSILCNHYQLRPIVSDDKVRLYVDGQLCQFKSNAVTEVVNAQYRVPGYPAEASLVINVSNEEIAFSNVDPPLDDCRAWGILLQSKKYSVYDNTFFYHQKPGIIDNMWDANARYITGTLVCPYLDTIILDGTNGNFSESNPFLIYNPGRRNGLDPKHPFTQALYDTAYKYLSVVINKVQDNRDKGLLNNDHTLSDLLHGLSEIISTFLTPPTALYRLRTEQDTDNIVKATMQSEAVYLNADYLGFDSTQVAALARGEVIEVAQLPSKQQSVNIVFTNDKKLKVQYQIHYDDAITIKINANDPLIAPYLSVSEQEVTMLHAGKALAVTAMIVTEITSNLKIRQHVLNGAINLDMHMLSYYLANHLENKRDIATSVAKAVQQIKNN